MGVIESKEASPRWSLLFYPKAMTASVREVL